MKDLTSSVYTFEKLIEGNYLYIDKTEYIWKLLNTAYGQYFLSRPRRFGKSLTVSTLEAIFSGKKELFKGLAIYDKPYDWKKYPVIHLDLGDIKSSSPDDLEQGLQQLLSEIANGYGIALTTPNAQSQFRELILVIARDEGQVAILIDEYDKPILGNVANPKVNEILKVLKGFYSVIKGTEPLQRFALLTGVSKFAHVSIFSDLNNLTDITMRAEYATMLGYTQGELEHYFAERIDEVAEKLQMERPQLLHEIKEWYNGYRFHANSATVYNPVSIAQFFSNCGEFNNYWFATGTPTFLLELVKQKQFDFERILKDPVPGIAFDAYEIDRLEPLPLLLQTGYLTIKSTVKEFGQTLYCLGFPNLEVQTAFDTYLLNCYTSLSKTDIESMGLQLARQVGSGNVDGFMKSLQEFFAAIPYGIHVRAEKYYQTIFYMIFLMLGIYIEAESQTNDGRIDAVVSAGDWIYVIEFKLNKTAEEAMAQIQNKEYAVKFQHCGKRIVLIGVNFDFAKGQITDWIKEEPGQV